MKGGCQNKLGEQLINKVVSDKHREKFQKFYKDQFAIKKNSKNIMNCVFPDCDELLKIDPTYENRFFTCANSHKFCSVCKILGHHDENKCKNVIKFIIFSMMKIFCNK